MTHLGELQPQTIYLIIGNILTFWVVYRLFAARKRKKALDLERPEVLARLRSYAYRLLAFWMIGTVANAVYSGGFPLWWLLTGSPKTYVDFGIPTLSGLLNAFYMFGLTALFLDYCVRRSKKTLAFVILMLGWQVVILSRGALSWTFLEMLGIYLLTHRFSIFRFLQVFFAVILFIVVFGLVGNLRMGGNNDFLMSYVSDEYVPIVNAIPSGFLWVYAYATAGINNVNANIVDLKPSYHLYYSTAALLPTVIRSSLYSAGDYPLQLVSNAFNVSSFYAGALADFGITGALIFAALMQMIIVIFYFPSQDGKIWAILASAVLFQALCLSVFWDTFTSLVSIAQIFLALNFRRLVGKRQSLKPASTR